MSNAEKMRARIERLEDTLRAVRVHGIVAGAAVMARAPDWQERVCHVLDLIDDALAEAEPKAAPTPSFVLRVAEGFQNLTKGTVRDE
jgi:hypothetical protein